MRRRPELGARSYHHIVFGKVWTIYIENLDQNFFMTLMKLRLDFLFKDLPQHLEIYLVGFALKFLIHQSDGVSGDLKSFVS